MAFGRWTQVTEEIRDGTQFDFDYAALLVASSLIAAMGLATDNVAVVVAAMLVSPVRVCPYVPTFSSRSNTLQRVL